MSISLSWENIPSEIWFTILEKLPIKSQVSLGCTCKRMYQLSLDPFLANREERTWVYLRDNTPLPDLLAKAITILRIPPPQNTDKDLEQKSLFLQGEIRRMSNLQKLIIEKDPEKNECMLSFSDLQSVILQQNLEELKAPLHFFTSKFYKEETLLHLAVKKGNVKLVDSLLSQMKVCFQNNKIMGDTTFSIAINACDEQENTPLTIAIEKRNEELILLLLKKGSRGKEYFLSRENLDLSPFMQDTIDKGGHLQVEYLAPSSFSAFFEAVAKSSSLLSLQVSRAGYREIKKTETDFFQSLARALQSNFQRCAALSKKDLEGTAKILKLLVLDLRDCEELTIQEVKPFFACLGLEELWLPINLLDYLDEQKQNLLHLLVQESPMNKKIARSLIAQGVALSSRDHKGHTPVELARELGFVKGNYEMAIFLEQAAKKKLAAIAFGKKCWEKYFGKVGKEPSLPMRILEILESPCPIFPEKKVQETHLLTLIPEKVNGKPLTLDYLQDLIKNPQGGGNKTTYRFYASGVQRDHGARPSGSSYWVLMTKDVLPNTRNKSYAEQLSELNSLAARAPKTNGVGAYQRPKALEAATSILMEYVRSGNRFYSDLEGINKQSTLTRCEETASGAQCQVAIGGFAASGLYVYYHIGAYGAFGLGGLRKCFDFFSSWHRRRRSKL